MKAEDCPKLDGCYKVNMILDKDLLDFQYAEAIRTVCSKCTEVKASGRGRVGKTKGEVKGGYQAGNKVA